MTRLALGRQSGVFECLHSCASRWLVYLIHPIALSKGFRVKLTEKFLKLRVRFSEADPVPISDVTDLLSKNPTKNLKIINLLSALGAVAQ
jgi:hypothetical protein